MGVWYEEWWGCEDEGSHQGDGSGIGVKTGLLLMGRIGRRVLIG